jgi:hypothetical protein
MTLCPIAIVASCKQCPAFKICPLKQAIGDYKAELPQNSAKGSKQKKRPKRGTRLHRQAPSRHREVRHPINAGLSRCQVFYIK